MNNKTTIAQQTLDNYGYKLSKEENSIFSVWNSILGKIHNTEEYNKEYYYGLYQIDKEININIQIGTKKDGSPIMRKKYGDLNDSVNILKNSLKDYYKDNIAKVLRQYEFVK